MAKQRPSAQVHVADGAGGLRPVEDLRFDAGAWPVQFQIGANSAHTWMAHLHAECEARGYPTSGISQLEAAENSGTLHIQLNSAPSASAFELVWERRRDKHLSIRARTGGQPPPAVTDLQAFLDAVSEAHRAKGVTRRHRRGYLVYRGRPWSGELWLSPNLCLGSPAKPGVYLNDPQIIVVDAVVEGIGSHGIIEEFARLMRELSIFLEVVVGIRAVEQRERRVWTYSTDAAGHYADFEIKSSAYYEPELHPQMPVAGARPAIPVHQVQRPGIERPIDLATMDQQSVPQDMEALWQLLQSLPKKLRRQFLEAGNAFANAQVFWPNQRTAYASFLVVACEALKPAGGRFDRANVYDVVNSLRGRAVADTLRSAQPQGVRSGHLHRGKVTDEELSPRFGSDYFRDPSFNDLLRALHQNCRICLIEWLRQGGTYSFQRMPPQRASLKQRLLRAMRVVRGLA
jgi:hypothetical protein